MAKFGKFVGKKFIDLDSNELSLFRETLDNVFERWKFNVGQTNVHKRTYIGCYEGEPFIQYSIKCWTNGKYHTYKRQYRNDGVFEGKNHYFYDTDIREFQLELAQWKANVMGGIDR